MKLFDRFISWLYTYRLFGSRCRVYDRECACCEAWETHDMIFNSRKFDVHREEEY